MGFSLDAWDYGAEAVFFNPAALSGVKKELRTGGPTARQDQTELRGYAVYALPIGDEVGFGVAWSARRSLIDDFARIYFNNRTFLFETQWDPDFVPGPDLDFVSRVTPQLDEETFTIAYGSYLPFRMKAKLSWGFGVKTIRSRVGFDRDVVFKTVSSRVIQLREWRTASFDLGLLLRDDFSCQTLADTLFAGLCKSLLGKTAARLSFGLVLRDFTEPRRIHPRDLEDFFLPPELATIPGTFAAGASARFGNGLTLAGSISNRDNDATAHLGAELEVDLCGLFGFCQKGRSLLQVRGGKTMFDSAGDMTTAGFSLQRKQTRFEYALIRRDGGTSHMVGMGWSLK